MAKVKILEDGSIKIESGNSETTLKAGVDSVTLKSIEIHDPSITISMEDLAKLIVCYDSTKICRVRTDIDTNVEASLLIYNRNDNETLNTLSNDFKSTNSLKESYYINKLKEADERLKDRIADAEEKFNNCMERRIKDQKEGNAYYAALIYMINDITAFNTKKLLKKNKLKVSDRTIRQIRESGSPRLLRNLNIPDY
jgi:hypothetical protein